MQIGFSLPQFGTLAHRPQEVARFAKQAEELGADSLWVGDRLLAPVNPTVGYAGTDTIPVDFHAVHDPLTLLAAAAAVTERVQLGTNVINVPWYAPALLARTLTTLELLSDGRLIPGFGIGWSPEESQAVGVPMSERGSRLDEFLDVLNAFWSTNPVEHSGRHWTIPASHSDLAPARHVPVYLGGFTPAAFQRIARRGDGWLPVAVTPLEFSAASITGPLEQIRADAEKLGRDPAQIGAILRVNPLGHASVADIATTLRRSNEEAGIEHAFVDLRSVQNVDELLDQAGQILAAARG